VFRALFGDASKGLQWAHSYFMPQAQKLWPKPEQQEPAHARIRLEINTEA